MKKHDEGYVLAYVTVVLLLFCLIASMILTSAMKNMNNQQNSIAQMKDKYVAQGMIEKVVALEIEEADEENTDLDGNVIRSLKVSRVSDGLQVIAQYRSIVITCVIDSEGNYVSYQVASVTEETGVPNETLP